MSNLFPVFMFCLILSAVNSSQQKQQQEHPIRTVIILVLENRSFDHMLGWMKKSINPHIDGVTGHSFEDVARQVFGSGSSSIPSMSGFVEQAMSMSPSLSETVMRGFRPEAVPVYADLVREFAVFNRWFSSIPGPTQPNRLFVYSATSHGSISHVVSQLALGYPQKTIFDSLDENGLDFGIYYQSIPSTLFYRNLRKLKYVWKFHEFDLEFFKDAQNGKLPNLTVIEPRYFDLIGLPANDDHPSHDVAEGQKLVKQVYETLRASPQWNETLFIITYDEHGGFYDHVETPYVDVPNPDVNNGPAPFFFKFDRLGVRVPTIMVSPWIKKGTVINGPRGPLPNSEFEHSSIPATIKKLFNLRSDYLTHRDAWAGTFEDIVLGLDSPRCDCPERLAEVTSLRRVEARENGALSEFQTEMVHLAAVLGGDHFQSSFPDEMSNKMSVKEAQDYVKAAVGSNSRRHISPRPLHRLSVPPPTSAAAPFLHLLQQQQQLQMFWSYQCQEIEQVDDFKNHQLPLTRIKKIMKADEDVRMISAGAPILFSKACELFITIHSWLHAEENKRRTLQKNDIPAAITRTDIFDFLIDIAPAIRSRRRPPSWASAAWLRPQPAGCPCPTTTLPWASLLPLREG
ncbi:hypothetical protein MLD38_032042 [Melastoma candidum]|uniref:Uncharacterized protein n=1 Tax=Melastoma candidum TaxID=119954 RepID=A0ACB9MSW3_9MYRT|nr:hypothetical protein MLD38_032042 [Melastoma candidum]